jgi:hypothetical protein
MKPKKRSTLRSKSARKRTTRRKKIPLAPRNADEFFAKPEEFQTDWEDMLRVIKRMRADSLSLRKAAQQEGVSPQVVTQLSGRALKKRNNRSYAATHRDSLLRVVLLPTSSGMRELALRDSQAASLVGRYHAAVKEAVLFGHYSGLREFKGRTVKDASGIRIPLITDPDELVRLASAGVLTFNSIYARSA